MATYRKKPPVAGKYINVSHHKKQLTYKGQVANIGELLTLNVADLQTPTIQSWIAHQLIKKINDNVVGVELGNNIIYEKIPISDGVYEVVKHQIPAEMQPQLISRPISDRKQVAFFMENISTHYSGGRYYAWLMIYALAEIGYDVTVCTNIKPTFALDFKDYKYQDRIRIMNNLYLNFDIPKNLFDLFVGIPREGGIKAAMNGHNMNVPSVLLIFESPNYTRVFRKGTDSTDEYWERYRKALPLATHILTLNKLCKEYSEEWIGMDRDSDKISALYPGINDKVADVVPERQEQHEVVFISRLVAHKHPEHAITAMRYVKNPPKINFICNRINEQRKKIYEDLAKSAGTSIEFHMGVNDFKKYEIIKRCKASIFPTTMEGFGIPPSESLYCGKPVVCYDTLFFREEYKDHLEYSPYSQGSEGLGKSMSKLLNDDAYRKKRGMAGRDYILKTMTFSAYCKNLQDILRKVLPNG